MLFHEALRGHLMRDPVLHEAVSGRIYPLKLPPRPAFPALSYFTVSAPRDYTHDGMSGLIERRMQISCWDLTYEGVKILADKVRRAFRALEDQPGKMVDFDIAAVFLDDETEFFEFDEVEHLSAYQVPLDYRFLHKED